MKILVKSPDVGALQVRRELTGRVLKLSDRGRPCIDRAVVTLTRVLTHRLGRDDPFLKTAGQLIHLSKGLVQIIDPVVDVLADLRVERREKRRPSWATANTF